MSSTDLKFDGEIFRKDRPIILAARRDLASLKGVRLAYNAAGYPAGQVVARNNVTGYYEKYDNGAASGLDVAVGVLMIGREEEDFASTGDTTVAQMIVGGEVFKDKLTGLDANGETDLGARTIVDGDGTNILKY